MLFAVEFEEVEEEDVGIDDIGPVDTSPRPADGEGDEDEGDDEMGPGIDDEARKCAPDEAERNAVDDEEPDEDDEDEDGVGGWVGDKSGFGNPVGTKLEWPEKRVDDSSQFNPRLYSDVKEAKSNKWWGEGWWLELGVCWCWGRRLWFMARLIPVRWRFDLSTLRKALGWLFGDGGDINRLEADVRLKGDREFIRGIDSAGWKLWTLLNSDIISLYSRLFLPASSLNLSSFTKESISKLLFLVTTVDVVLLWLLLLVIEGWLKDADGPDDDEETTSPLISRWSFALIFDIFM